MKIRLIKAKEFEQKLFDEQVLPDLSDTESKDRLIIQKWIEENNFKPAVLYNGNTIIRKDRIIKEFHRILKRGTLDKMSNYFYEFLHLDAGSIAHYNKCGWIDTYGNSARRLCMFFLKNEYGNNIITEQPRWKTDCISIGIEILRIIDEKGKRRAA